jgi:hypothetical protein
MTAKKSKGQNCTTKMTNDAKYFQWELVYTYMKRALR